MEAIVIWLFVSCVFEEDVCRPGVEIALGYEACAEMQLQHAKDHVDKDYWSMCKRVEELRT